MVRRQQAQLRGFDFPRAVPEHRGLPSGKQTKRKITNMNTQSTTTRSEIWLPLSQIKRNGASVTMPAWLASAKGIK